MIIQSSVDAPYKEYISERTPSFLNIFAKFLLFIIFPYYLLNIFLNTLIPMQGLNVVLMSKLLLYKVYKNSR